MTSSLSRSLRESPGVDSRRQMNADRHAAAAARQDLERAPMRLRDLAAKVQPESRAVRFGGEKRLSGSREILGLHARTAIEDGNDHLMILRHFELHLVGRAS